MAARRGLAFSIQYSLFNHVQKRFRTIFALSSGQTRAAIAIIRVSGPSASSVLAKMTQWKSNSPRPGYLFYTPIQHPVTQELLDKAMAVWNPGPRTFTGEDCCELHVHGGPAVVSDILEAISKVDQCVPAEPGEFTKRAFFNGKLDLTSVEGLADLLRAETSAQRKLALRQTGGELKKLYGTWRQRLIKCVAHVEAFVDFAEDAHLEESVLLEARRDVQSLLEEMERHLLDGRVGERLRDGVRVAIVGEPNVGKSSLLNRICGRPAAIVTSIAGTTRDPLDVALNLRGYPVLMTDTAGLRDTDDVVEVEGVRRAKEKLRQADVLMVVVDASGTSYDRTQVQNVIRETLSAAEDHSDQGSGTVNVSHVRHPPPETILVLNKVDLVGMNEDTMRRDGDKKPTSSGPSVKTIRTSCLNGDGLDQLIDTLTGIVQDMCSTSETCSTIPFTQERHRFLVTEAVESLQSFLLLCSQGGRDVVFAAESLREAMRALGRITGEEVTTDEMLNVLFRDFCIGK